MAVAQGSGYHQHGDADRVLAYAIVASILAHALVLLVMPGWLDPVKKKRVSTLPLVAHLVPRPAPAPAVEPLPKVETPPETASKPRPAERPRPILAAPPALSPAQAPTVVPSAPVAEPPRIAEPVQPAAPAISTGPPRKLEPSAPPSAAPSAAEATDPATLGQYRIAIITAAKRYKRYPRLALDNNWEGRAEIRMEIGADGSIASIAIKSGSGFEVLDQQALEMIRKAKPLTPIPAALRGRGFTVDVPVVFSLKEESG